MYAYQHCYIQGHIFSYEIKLNHTCILVYYHAWLLNIPNNISVILVVITLCFSVYDLGRVNHWTTYELCVGRTWGTNGSTECGLKLKNMVYLYKILDLRLGTTRCTVRHAIRNLLLSWLSTSVIGAVVNYNRILPHVKLTERSRGSLQCRKTLLSSTGYDFVVGSTDVLTQSWILPVETPSRSRSPYKTRRLGRPVCTKRRGPRSRTDGNSQICPPTIVRTTIDCLRLRTTTWSTFSIVSTIKPEVRQPLVPWSGFRQRIGSEPLEIRLWNACL